MNPFHFASTRTLPGGYIASVVALVLDHVHPGKRCRVDPRPC